MTKMKVQFSEFYSPQKTEFKDLWANAIFVLDTNVLLSLYRFPPKTQAKLLNVLKKLKHRLWIPHQVALEYHRKRLTVICSQEKSYKEMLDVLSRFEGQYIEHPFLHDKKITKSISNACVSIRKEIETLEISRPKWLEEDNVLENIEKIFEGKIGNPYDEKKLQEIYGEGAERYVKDVPPGYKDAVKDKSDKSKTRKFGDLIIWYQILDKAVEAKKPVIFVTDEQKEDWWWKEEGGRNIGARHELKKEMLDRAGTAFHMYQSDQFMDHAQEHLKTKIDKKLIDEIKKMREEMAKFAEVESLSAQSASDSLSAEASFTPTTSAESSIDLGRSQTAGESSGNLGGPSSGLSEEMQS